MKRFLALALAVLMILSFAACTSDKSGSDTTAASDTKTDTATAPAAGKLTNLWMAYNPSYHVVTTPNIPNGQFAGLSIDPRAFTNPMNRTFSIFKPVKYDNIVVSVDAVSGENIARGTILEGAANSTLLTKVAQHTAGNTAFVVEWQGVLPFPQAGIGNDFYTGYKIECIEA